MSLDELNKQIFELQEENKSLGESINAILEVKELKAKQKENKDSIKELNNQIKDIVGTPYKKPKEKKLKKTK